jgi:hypothetical protein
MGDRTAFERKWFGSWWCVCWCVGVLVCWCFLSKGLAQPLPSSLPQWLDIYCDFFDANGFAIYFLVLVLHLLPRALMCVNVLGLANATCFFVEKLSEMFLDHMGITGDWHFLQQK